MRKLLLVILVGTACWTAYTRYQHHQMTESQHSTAPALALAPAPTSRSTFACDGRVYCSQMTSCEEATYFLEHCPGTKMDGNHDGVPCERQWCR